jgi:peptide/nickel transport system permease protein
MRLRTFLVKRGIHTAITLIIVLVLLFVIFRLMPGDPTRFFIRPGQTKADTDRLLVDFGFAKEVPAPGNGYEAPFETSLDGAYEITITTNDSAGRSGRFYVSHARALVPIRNESAVFVTASSTTGEVPWEIGPGDEVDLSLRFENPRAGEDYYANATVSRDGNPITTIRMGTGTSTSWTPTEVGAYTVRVDVRGTLTTELVGYAGVGVNVHDPSPFQLVDEWKLTTFALLPNLGVVVVNVTSEGAGITRVSAEVREPDGSVEGKIMFHPMIVVENSIVEEFWVYFSSMLQGDFGDSLYSRRPVWDEIGQRVGPSLLLFGSAVIISYALGILIGAVLAWRRGSKMELGSIVVSLFFYSMPVFWFGLILLWAFAFTFRLFPLRGFADLDAVHAGGLTYVGNVLWHMSLPLLNLVILSLAGHVLLMRNSMLEVMGEDYITTAKAKGISERRVMYRHAARNAMLPVVTAFALSISGVISGGVLTETIFSWPGMGAFLIQSTLNQDFPSVQGAFFLLALLTIMANLVADLLYAYLDPRVRL